MAAKLSARRKASFLLLAISIVLYFSLLCRTNAKETEPVPLEDFNVGVSRSAPRRYFIRDLKVGEVSVQRLFKVPPRAAPAWCPGGYLRSEEFVLIINGGRELDELKKVLIAHPKLPLEVVLRDAWNPFGNSEDRCEYSIRIPVTFKETDCDKVTRLIYEKIISNLIEEVNEERIIQTGQANRRLDINEVFDKLRDDKQIEAYINQLRPDTNNPCVETIRLLKWQTEQKVTGFASGEYTLDTKIQKGLTLIISAMATERDWWKSDLSVKVGGFTDEVEVNKTKEKERHRDRAGITSDAWSRINNRFEVYYSGCEGNRLKEKDRFVYLNFTGGRGEHLVGTRITNNCELGAVRAYVAMVYLTSELGRNSTDDSYATGGIFSSTAGNRKDDPEKRRIHIEFTIRAAKVDQSNP